MRHSNVINHGFAITNYIWIIGNYSDDFNDLAVVSTNRKPLSDAISKRDLDNNSLYIFYAREHGYFPLSLVVFLNSSINSGEGGYVPGNFAPWRTFSKIKSSIKCCSAAATATSSAISWGITKTPS